MNHPWVMSSSAFWSASQPGFRFTDAEPGSERFFREIEEHRYALEAHIPDVARFDEWARKDVLDVGCGLATDGSRFARSGAHYVGFDQAGLALELARRRFELEQLMAVSSRATRPCCHSQTESFDLVWSHGVIHHIPETERAVTEFRRVLRPGGTALVMVCPPELPQLPGQHPRHPAGPRCNAGCSRCREAAAVRSARGQ